MKYSFSLSSTVDESRKNVVRTTEIPRNIGKVVLVIVTLVMLIVGPVILGLMANLQIPDESLLLATGLMLGYSGVVLLLIMPWLGSWATTVPATAGVAVVDSATLTSRLLAINDINVPFSITQKKPGKFILEWRYADASWMGLLFAGKVSYKYRLYLRLDEQRKIVRATETIVKSSWDAQGPVPVLKAGFHISFFRGISLISIHSGRLTGILIKDGKIVVDDAYRFSFSPDVVAQPIIGIITNSGWNYVPSVF